MNSKIFLFLPFFITSIPGHELWIQPDKFMYKRTETINLKFLWGEPFDGSNRMNDNQAKNLSLYFEDVSDTSLHEHLGESGDSLQLAMIDEGTVMLTLVTRNTLVDMGAMEFNQYIHDHDMTEALDSRTGKGDSLKKGHENYQQNVKTILQVGNKFTNVFRKRTNLPLDIVPTDHPYKIAKDGNFKVQLFFKGQKLRASKVNVWHKLDDKVSRQEYTTNDDGEIKFFLSPEGEWMVSCVKMIRAENGADAEWQSYWGSLTWGY